MYYERGSISCYVNRALIVNLEIVLRVSTLVFQEISFINFYYEDLVFRRTKKLIVQVIKVVKIIIFFDKFRIS